MDVGGNNCHRLSPMYYTSIAEINSFRCGKIWFYGIEPKLKQSDIELFAVHQFSQ